MFTRPAILQLVLVLLAACSPKEEQECGEGEYKTVDGDCVADTGDDGSEIIDGDDPPEPVKETGGEQIETSEPEETAEIRETGEVEETGEPEETGDPGSSELSVEVEQSSRGVMVTIDAYLSGFELGLVETDPAASDPWTGEDCLSGYTTGSGTVYDICHPIEDQLLMLKTADSLDDLVAGETTLFGYVDPRVTTYFLTSLATGECWVWGHDVSYYSDMGCIEL